jgi:hypothetical protein
MMILILIQTLIILIINKKTIQSMYDENIWLAVGLQILSCSILLIFVLRFAKLSEGPGKRFIHLGPSNKHVPINIIGVHIDTWKKWVILSTILCILEGVNTYSFKKYKTWYRHGIVAQGGTHISPNASIVIITLWRLCTFVPHTFKWLTVIATQQVQFLLPALLIRTTLSNIMDYNAMDIITHNE